MSNENYFPPKCCLLEIPTKVVHANITSQQKDLFKSKAQEYAVPAGQRWYCPHTDCTKWIPVSKQPSRTENLRCPHCKKSACTVCRGVAHLPGADCPQDFGLEATLDESERNGWKRCYKCRAMVELTLGCRHIRCKCRAEFCYVCTAPWRTCSCTEMDQARQQAEIESRRQRDDVEARETAEAIRAVEEAQRVEDEMREFDERIRRIEEEERMRADAARREEEESRKRVQAEHERAALVDKFASLRRDLDSIQSAQREAIGQRHIRELSEVVQQRAASKSKANKGQEGERQRLRRDNEEAMRVLEERQAQELEALERRHEEEEDDYFLGIRAHLRGKANREARERAAVEKVRRVQAEDKARTLSEHKAALRHAHLDDQKLAEALSALEAGRKAELEHEERWLRERQQHIAADIRWFEAIEAERLALLRQREHEALNPGVPLIDSSSPSAPLRQLKLDSSVSTAAHAQPRPTMQPPPRSVARPPPSFPSLPPPSSTPSFSSPLLLQPSPQPQPILAAIDIENPWREDGTRHRAELSSSTSLRRSQMVRRPRKSSSSSSATSASAEQNMLAEKTTPVDERPLSSLKELKGALSDMPPPPSPVPIKPRHPVRAMQHADDVNAIAYWATPRWSRGPERTRL
ncbi:MAG: hypothetical protein M1825_000758 [Sarcosagium campestre]|nr:MAG: hypothetical protein M1825_000758 [Sarcosagium campestre]